MKSVAVSQRIDAHITRAEQRDALDLRLTEFICAAGYLPVPVPNKLCVRTDSPTIAYDIIERWFAALNPDALVLSGGNDIGMHKARDITETWMLDFAKQNYLPVLGICRGMQMMAVAAGGQLKSITGHVATRHNLTGELAANVNSYHNHALLECPPDFVVLARSEDGEIEAIRHNNLPWQGWMWHPEREATISADDIQNLCRLFG